MSSPPGDGSRASDEQQLRELAQELRDLSTTRGGAGHEESILGFAAQADSYADQIRDASSPEAVTALVAEATRKQAQWTQLLELLNLAERLGNEEGEGSLLAQEVLAAEEKLRSTASQLRAVADSGRTEVFNAIGRVATEAETGLADFLAAETPEDKLLIFTRFEESRTQWIAQMEGLHSTVMDGSESQAPTEAPDAEDVCEYVDDAPEESSCRPAAEATASDGCTIASAGYGGGWAGYGGGCTSLPSVASATGCSAASSAPAAEAPLAVSESAPPPLSQDLSSLTDLTPKEAREQIAIYLKDEDEGLLATLRRSVAKVLEDERFEGVHEDAGKLLEQMELAAGAIIPEALVQEFPDDLAGAEEKLKATVEPMRKAQWGGFYAKKAAFAVQKYDLYKAKGKMPKLKDEHSELLECAKVSVDVAEFLRKEAQNGIMDSVTGLVKQTTEG